MSGRRGPGSCHGNRENRIGSQLRLVWRSVSFDHHLVDGSLIAGILAHHGSGEFLVHVRYGLRDSLSAKPLLISVTQFDRFFFSRGGPGRDGCDANRATCEPNFGLNCRIPAGIEISRPCTPTMFVMKNS